MEINWMFLTYLTIGFFAFNGFFRGWWKEAITIIILAFLILLLQQPEWAQAIIDGINQVILVGWQFISGVTGLTLIGEVFQIDASEGGTWLMILILR